MVIRKLIDITNYLIGIVVALFILSFVWFIGINKSLTSPGSYDIRILGYLMIIFLSLILIRFILVRISKK